MTKLETIYSAAAPEAIGPYSQAIKAENLVFLSGQIPLDPVTMKLVGTDVETQARQVFANLAAVATAAGGSLSQCCKLTIYLTDLEDFASVNDIMAQYFAKPYPARATLGINALPKGALIEIDAIMAL